MKEANWYLNCEVTGVKLSESDVKRFWSKVDKNGGEDACWEWLAGKNKSGYGKFSTVDKHWRAHRAAWIIASKEIPSDNLYVCHKCDNPGCVNPAHLFLGLPKDNAADMAAKGRSLSGDRNPSRTRPERLRRGDNHPVRLNPSLVKRGSDSSNTHLTEADVIEIKRLWHNSRITSRQLAEKYSIGKTSVLRIIHGKTWAHLQHHSQL